MRAGGGGGEGGVEGEGSAVVKSGRSGVGMVVGRREGREAERMSRSL